MIKSFELYRYQIIPIDRESIQFEFELFSEINSINELLDQKNKIFFSILDDSFKLKYRKKEVNHKLFKRDDFASLKIGVKRVHHLENQDFEKQRIETWPSKDIYIYNNKEVQTLAISNNSQATFDVAEMLTKNFNRYLKRFNLQINILPIYRKTEFWDTINKYSGRIQGIYFNIITPNMSNISKSLSEDLKKIAKATNSSHTQLEMHSNSDSTLKFNPNSGISDLTDYTANGGGSISIKLRGVRKRMNTNENKISIEIDEVDVDCNVDDINAVKEVMTWIQ